MRATLLFVLLINIHAIYEYEISIIHIEIYELKRRVNESENGA